MNEKEIAEIRRRFRPETSNITHIRGCCVNKEREIVSEFNQSIARMPEEDAENFLSVLKKTLSGRLDQNLIDIEFSTQQVVDSEEHKLLMALKNSALQDEEAVHALFDQIIASVVMEENYLILLASDTYDIPYRARDGQTVYDASSETYTYFLCSVCPVKMTKPALSYHAAENEFGSCTIDWLVSPPEMGFLFPSFDDRSANIYNSLYYTRRAEENYPEFIRAVFGREAPMPAAEQRETFQGVLCGALEEECSFETVQAVQEQLQNLREEHKANREEEPLAISKQQVKTILQTQGVSQERVQAFETQFDESLGAETRLAPQNMVETKKLEVTMPDVKIQVHPGREDLVETRKIDGIRYVLIRAEEGVELNGVPVHIS